MSEEVTAEYLLYCVFRDICDDRQLSGPRVCMRQFDGHQPPAVGLSQKSGENPQPGQSSLCPPYRLSNLCVTETAAGVSDKD